MKLHKQASLLIIATALVLGIVTDTLVRQDIFGLNFVVWSAIWMLLAVAAAYYKKRPLLGLAPYVVLGSVNSVLVYVRAEPIVQFWSVMISLVCLALIFLRVLIDNFSEIGILSRTLEFITGSFVSVFSVLNRMIESFSSGREHAEVNKKVSIGVLIAIPLVLIFLALFASSDQVLRSNLSWIGDAFNSFADWLSKFDIARGVSVTFWSVVAFSGLAVLIRKGYISRLSTIHLPAKLEVKDANIVIGSVSAVFALFILIQLRYLFSGGSLPDGITYASYARRGYGELLLATLLACTVVYLVNSTTKVVTKLSKILTFALLGLNALVVLSAWKRLSLYESAYGWTMTRFVARMGLVCILIGIVSLIAWRLHKLNKTGVFVVNWYSLALVLTVSALLNPIGLITKRNIVDRDKREVALDTNHIIHQSEDSYPAICAYAPRLKASHLDEFAALADRKETLTTFDGKTFVTSERRNENAVEPSNVGLAAHYTQSKHYLDTYKYCLQK